MRYPNIISAFVLALGIAAMGYFVSQTIVNGRTAVNTATVKGLAERVVDADTANWTITYFAGRTVPHSSANTVPQPINQKALYDRADYKRDAILDVLREAGFTSDEIQRSPAVLNIIPRRDDGGRLIETRYEVIGHVKLTSQNLDLVRETQFVMADLPRNGVIINIETPKFTFTRLNDIKPDMLREATQNARLAADEFAKDANVEVGGIQNAVQGGFMVRDVGGYDETQALQKDVRVVTTITFYLEN